jgi:hypothetical protein
MFIPDPDLYPSRMRLRLEFLSRTVSKVDNTMGARNLVVVGIVLPYWPGRLHRLAELKNLKIFNYAFLACLQV